MIDWKARADELLEEFDLCIKSRPRQNAVDIQLLKDSCGKWAYQLATQRSWGSDQEIAEACHQLEPKLRQLKQQVIIEILTNGTI
jgi:hypothetical protein